MTYWFGAHDDSIAYRRAQGQRKQAAEKATELFYMTRPTARPSGYKKWPLATRQHTGMHVVAPGDNYESIGKLYGVMPNEMQEANPRVPANRLRVGAAVNVPISKREMWMIDTDGNFDPEVTQAMPRSRVVPMLAQESMFNPAAVSKDGGAYGLFQIRQPALDQAIKLDPRLKGWKLEDMKDPYKARYVHTLLMDELQRDWQYRNGMDFGEKDGSLWWRAWNQPRKTGGTVADSYVAQVSRHTTPEGIRAMDAPYRSFLNKYPGFFDWYGE